MSNSKTPTETLINRGSWRGVARAKQEAPAIAEAPPAPGFLKGEAKREWNRQIENLRDQNLLSRTYRNALAIYCQAWGEYYEISRAMEDGLLVLDEDLGELVPAANIRKLLDVRKQALECLLKIGPQFGWTPATKPNVKISGPGPITPPKGKGAGQQETYSTPEDFFTQPRIVG